MGFTRRPEVRSVRDEHIGRVRMLPAQLAQRPQFRPADRMRRGDAALGLARRGVRCSFQHG